MSARKFNLRGTPTLLLSVLVLVIALGSSASAAYMVGSANIKKNAVKSKHISKNAVKSKHIKNKSIKVADLSPAAIQALSGSPGPQGPKGPKGDVGLSGIYVKTVNVNFRNVELDVTEDGVAKCDAGDIALNGGARYRSSGYGHLDASAPAHVAPDGTWDHPSTASLDEPANGWYASARKTKAGLPGYLYISVTCAKLG